MLNSLSNSEYNLYNVALTSKSYSSANENQSSTAEMFLNATNTLTEDSFIMNNISENQESNSPINSTESCGSLAQNIETNDSSDTESCGSLAFGSITPELTTMTMNNSTCVSETSSTKASSSDSSISSITSDNTNTYYGASGIQNTSSKENAQLSSGGASSDTSSQTSDEISSNAESQASSNSSEISSNTSAEANSISAPSDSSATEQGNIASSNMDCAQACGDNLAYGGNYGMNTQSPTQDAQNGSWTGSFVKENTGWTGAYVDGAASQVNENNSIADTQCSSGAMPTGSFGEMTAFAHSIMTTDGAQIQPNNVTVGAFGASLSMAGAISGSMSMGTTAGGCASSSSSSCSSSSSAAA